MADFVAVVQFADDRDDIGAVWADPDGALFALWPDGGADVVFRDARGWLWDEYGTDDVRVPRYWSEDFVWTTERLAEVERLDREAARG